MRIFMNHRILRNSEWHGEVEGRGREGMGIQAKMIICRTGNLKV